MFLRSAARANRWSSGILAESDRGCGAQRNSHNAIRRERPKSAARFFAFAIFFCYLKIFRLHPNHHQNSVLHDVFLPSQFSFLNIRPGLSCQIAMIKVCFIIIIRNENEITYRFESRFILSDYVAKRQEYSSIPTFSCLGRQATRLSKTGNLFNSRSLG